MVANDCAQTPPQVDNESPQLSKTPLGIPSREGFDELDPNPPDDKLVTAIDRLSNDLGVLDPASDDFKQALRELQGICSSQVLPPSSHVLPSNALETDEHAFSSGGFSDVHEGMYKDEKVCVKRLRATLVNSLEEAIKMLFREAFLWKRLIHPNIVPFRGMTIDPLQIASEWMPKGELTTYINLNPGVNRVDLLVDVANGLDYLHSYGIIHGDLKGPNILVDGSGHARITDFGLARDTAGVVSLAEAHSPRWTAPEVLTGETPNMKADVFSFAMVMVEAFTGTIPFNQYTSLVATVAIIQEERPPRPTHPTFTDELWELMQRCWDRDQDKRPRTSEVFVELLDKAISHTPVADDLFRKALCRLQSACSIREVLPVSCLIPNERLSNKGEVTVSGGFADVYQAELNGKKVCVKTCKSCDQNATGITKKTLYEEVVVWKRLQHPNIVPFLGVSTRIESTLEIVYDWMENGRIAEYVERNPKVDRINLVCDVADGLCYLHSSNVIHGNLEDANILIDKDGHARLTNVGLTSIIREDNSTRSPQDSNPVNTTMWAPEILNGGPVSKEGDVFAFAVVASEILKEDVPSDTKVSLEGHHQEARKPLHDELWPFIRRCLKREPRERPTTDQLLEFFQNFRFLREQAKPKAQILPSASGPGEHPSLHATNPLPGQNFPRETIDGDGTNANNLDSMSDGDALHEPTIQPSADSTRNGDDDPATCGTDLESNGVTDNTPHTGQPSQPKDFDAATPLVNYRDAAGMAGGAKDAHIPSPEDGSGIPETPATVTAHTASTKISLTKITNWNEKSGDISQMLTTAFESKDYLDCVKNLRALDIDPLSYINSLDKIIDSLSTNSDLRKRCIRELSRTCGAHGILPTSYAITFTLSKPGPRPFASGGSSDIWRLTDENACDRIFTVKSLRVYEQDPVDEINKRYCEAVIALKRANHPNILPIEGVARELFEFCMVSQWIPGGLMGHVEKCPEANRLELLIGVTRGLDYLHDNEIVHGDLRSTNILVDANGSPRLSGFGLCSITKHTNSVNASTPNDGSMVRYCAPELLDTNWVTQVEKKKPTNKSDVYSLSMVIVELVTGKVPFPDLTDAHITIGVPKGIRPPKPRPFKAPGMTPVVWKIAKKCWRGKAEERLEVKAVLQYLENPPNHDGKLSQALRSTVAKGSLQLSTIHRKVRSLPSNPKT